VVRGLSKPVLVIGGGIAGIQTAIDVADQGLKVFLVEKTPSIGGKMSQLDKTFPTLDCASCILTPKMVAASRHKNIEMLTYSEVKEIRGSDGDFTVTVVKKPRYVNFDACTGCGECFLKCPAKVPDEFNMGLSERRAIYVPFAQAVPRKATIDAEHCWRLNPPEKLRDKAKERGIVLCGVCARVCPPKAIDFNQKEEVVDLNVSSIVIATGLELEDPRRVPEYGYGKYANVYTHLEFERLLSSTGPTGGEILRRSDNAHPKKIAFIQCVCSRDRRTNFYCSAFCCMASVKESLLAKEHLPSVDCTIFYMDIRTFGKGYYQFYRRTEEEYGIKYVRGKVARIEERADTKNLTLVYEDTLAGSFQRADFDMVILAVGIKPSPISPAIPIRTSPANEDETPSPLALEVEEDRFPRILNPYLNPVATSVRGIFVAGVAAGAKDIPDSVMQASAAAMKSSLIAAKEVKA
jgi:heterodisulfide reductase subunit A2